MADQWNSNNPALSNQVAEDIPDIKENLEHAKDALQRIFETWSDSAGGNASAKLDSSVGFNDGTYNYEFPTNGVAAHSVIMLGNSSTVVWMYLNAAPPGWKVQTTGQGTVMAISDTTGTSNGTTTGTTADKLVDSGATFSSDGVVAGDTVYNVTDSTVTTVSAVDSETTLSVSDDYFVSGEEYIVGKPYVEAGGRKTANGGWTLPAHVHQWYNYINSATHAQSYNSAGSAQNLAGTAVSSTIRQPEITAGVDTGMNADQYTTSVTPAATWRPTASIGKLFKLDTA